MARILLVDDEPEILFLTRMMLEKKGYEVCEVKSGKECIEELKSRKADVVLLDVLLHNEDGWEVCKKIKSSEETKNIPVAMFTVRTSPDSIEKSKKCGADAHINKPFDMEDLYKTIERLLQKPSQSLIQEI
jgi:CheY-like chemotaxis protein